MKKLISAVLVTALLLSFGITAFAETVVSDVSEMLAVVKERIGSTDEYDKLSSSTYIDEFGNTVYNFRWAKTSDDDYRSLRVEINDEGIITSYHKSQNYSGTRAPGINHPTGDDALKTAKEQIAKLNPSVCDKIHVSKYSDTESLRGKEFEFTVLRYENEIPVFGDNGYAAVSADASELVSFNINYTIGIKCEETQNNLSYDEAVKKYAEKIGMQLYYSENGDGDITLWYKPAKSDVYIDASNGESVYIGKDSSSRFSATENSKDAASGGSSGNVGFTQVEIDEINVIGGLKSYSDIEKDIRKNNVVNLSDDYKTEQTSLTKSYGNDEYVYYFEFIKKVSDNTCWAYVTADAKSGKILSFYKEEFDYRSEVKKLSYEEMLHACENALELLAPEHFGIGGDDEYRLYQKNNESADENCGIFSYVRYMNDIPYFDNSAEVSVNAENGEIYSYSLNCDELEFPSAEGVVSADKAAELMLEQTNYKIWYMPLFDGNQIKNVKIVYATDAYNQIIDAFSGKLKYSEDAETVGGYVDIEGHYAENAIETLAKYSIGFGGDTFKPDASITQKEFVALIDAVFVYNAPVVLNDDYNYGITFNVAKKNGIITDDEYNPNAYISRDFASQLFIRALGFEEVAKLDGIFISKFTDANDKCGYTSILSAMGIVHGDEYGRFNFNTELTRADALMMLYNYLAR